MQESSFVDFLGIVFVYQSNAEDFANVNLNDHPRIIFPHVHHHRLKFSISIIFLLHIIPDSQYDAPMETLLKLNDSPQISVYTMNLKT